MFPIPLGDSQALEVSYFNDISEFPMSTDQVPPPAKKPVLSGSGLFSRKNLFRFGLLGVAGIALLLLPASTYIAVTAALGGVVGIFGTALVASLTSSSVSALFTSKANTPSSSVAADSKKAASITSSAKTVKKEEKAAVPRGKDIGDPMTNLLVKQLEQCGLQVCTDWNYAKVVLATLPEKYDHLIKNQKKVNGFVYQGVVYINPSAKTDATPIHEYTHVWAEMLRQKNPDEWKHVVGMLKENTELWDKIQEAYPHLEGDDEIADEVLATFSGNYASKFIHDHYDADRSPADVLGSVREALSAFWSSVCSILNVRFTSTEQVSSMVLRDFLNGVNPMEDIDERKRMSDRVPLGSTATVAVPEGTSINKKNAVMNNKAIIVLTGEEARKAVADILASEKDGRYPLMVGKAGYFRDTNGNGDTVYSAFDNTTGDCWCEDFKTAEGAEKWCWGELSTDEVRELEGNVEEIILNKDSFADWLKKDTGPKFNGGYPPYVKFDEHGEFALDMQFHDGYAFDTNPHGLGVYDRIGLYYPTVAEVAKSPEMQEAIEDHTGRRWAEGSRQEQIFDIALKYGQAGRIHCPKERFDAAVKAIVERAADPSARAFTVEQREKVQLAAACNGEMFYTPGSFRQVFYDNLFDRAKEQMQHVPVAWAKDAHEELQDLAHEKVRDEGLGLRR